MFIEPINSHDNLLFIPTAFEDTQGQHFFLFKQQNYVRLNETISNYTER